MAERRAGENHQWLGPAWLFVLLLNGSKIHLRRSFIQSRNELRSQIEAENRRGDGQQERNVSVVHGKRMPRLRMP